MLRPWRRAKARTDETLDRIGDAIILDEVERIAI
jgi:hypothetical protein